MMTFFALALVYLVVPFTAYLVVRQSTGSKLFACGAAVIAVFLAVAILERAGRALSRWYRGS